jgi:hypothetical protein
MNFLQLRKTITIMVVAALVLVLGYAGYAWWQSKQETPDSGEPVITTKAVPQDQLPSQFPAGIPIEKGAKTLVSLDQTSTDGRFQGTRKFVTAKSIEQNAAIYKEFLTEDGWKTVSSTDTDTLKHFSARKGDLLIQIVLNEAEITDGNTVEIIVQQAEPAPGE